MTPPTAEQVILAADRFREAGFNPLPSRTDRKAPILKYTELREKPLSKESFDEIAIRNARQNGSVNLQVLTGAHWGLAVVDLDSRSAIEAWQAWCRFRPVEPTWTVVGRNPDGSLRGQHLWFRISPANPMRSRLLWGMWDEKAGTWVKRNKIELLCDRQQVMAPPSVNPQSLMPYCWADGCSPADLTRPARLPDWVASLPDFLPPRTEEVATAAPKPIPKPGGDGCWFRSEDVLAAIPCKISVARDLFGLRIATTVPNSDGWVRCRAIDRQDNNPSASFNVVSGYYFDHGTGERRSLFDLGVAMGHYSDWLECLKDLGRRFAARCPTSGVASARQYR